MPRVPVEFHAAHVRRAAFTLIELLAVMALMGLLMTLGLGAMQGARSQAAVARARAELAALSLMLEQYRRDNGDYPQAVTTPQELYQALNGHMNPDGGVINARNCVGSARIALRDEAHPGNAMNSFVDPWGHDYQYAYFSRTRGSSEPERGYVLFSYGARAESELLPSVEAVVPERTGARGGMIATAPNTAANLYANH